MSKLCPDCGEVKPLDEFYDKKNGKDGKATYCKPCHNVRSDAWKKANPEKRLLVQRRSKLKKYGITVEQYDEMLEEQGGVCACCGTDDPGRDGSFYVDHCHDSEDVRGLLCHKCNSGIGYLGDNVDGVWQAILYLVKYEQKELTA